MRPSSRASYSLRAKLRRPCSSMKLPFAQAPAARCRCSAGHRAWRCPRRSRTEPYLRWAVSGIAFIQTWLRMKCTSSCPARSSKPFPMRSELSQQRTPPWKNSRAAAKPRYPQCSFSNGHVAQASVCGLCCSKAIHPPTNPQRLKHTPKVSLQLPQSLIKLRHGFDPSKIIFQRNMLVGRVRVLIRQSKSEQDARHLERVMHLRDEWNRAALADEDGALAEPLLEGVMRDLKKRMRIRRDPSLAPAEQFKFELHRFRQQLPDLPLNGLRDFVRILI